MSCPGKVLSRKFLMKNVWDTDYVGDTRTLEVHVCWLRRKLERVSGGTPRLAAVRGVGYRLEEQHFDGLSTSSETPGTANRLPNSFCVDTSWYSEGRRFVVDSSEKPKAARAARRSIHWCAQLTEWNDCPASSSASGS